MQVTSHRSVSAEPGNQVRTGSRQPSRGPEPLNAKALSAYLAEQLPELQGPLTIEKFRAGQSNPTFRVGSAGGEFVLRKQPPGRLLPGAHAVDREFRILTALSGCGVPVPRTLHFCEDPSVIGTPFYLMEHLRGRVLRDPLLPGMQAAERAAIYDAMNDVLARLHGLDWQALGLEGFGKPADYIARQIALWSRQYRATRTDRVTAMERLMEWLPEHLPGDDSISVVHGDYRLENLMFDPRAPRVIAVLDWELSTLGHPLSDLSFNCMTYHLPSANEIAPGFVGTDLEGTGIPGEAEYVARYCARTGRGEIENWKFYVAFSLFRTAAIQQGVHARALRGNASSETAHRFGALYPLVAERGWALAKKL